MRTFSAALTILGLAAVGLTGCAAPADTTCDRPAGDAGVLDLVSVSGAADALPDVDVYTPFRTDEWAARDDVTGDGTPITTDDQLVVVDIALVGGDSGETVIATPYDGDLTRVTTLSQWVNTFPAFSDALSCATEGSRVTVALAPGDIAEGAAEGLGLAADESALAIVDVRKVYLAKADGADQYTDGFGLPSVVRAPDGQPGLIIPEGAPPSELVVQTLKKGDGPVVTGDAPVRVHYTGVTWAEREEFDSSWGQAPASLTLDGVVPGFAAALEGQTVGSQVLVVIPPDQGYGDTAQGAIPAGSTLVFVIDILGLDAAP
ncbi:FKBP-type peptidyl-prolyl cis-trans isomerase [Microbacterium aurantiacum]|uniref:Peptidyl-prolyl cis-trans isomerase n=2 Tax=Microbacterium aurantiacum TaxID=162393 RepID=A0AAJ2HEF5_9MICO|nr:MULTISPECIES: FKBP-type peptidyl-prolyl cis-trans isomerase [Microbacterium]ODT11657.1 MAG: hypothetical protein ABS61_02540 [Microbacterium sp. SCN 70-18]ANG85641.1 hypothetical protein A8L33_09770 [Microbacterium chocolatum]KOS11384.1 hypothetical protein XI38_05880 [Microbacterium chocolatum]MDN4463365.1 FKBP-type peptidyl-prolyl cis-trans isomerase [Microbacterium aurantiacum]MDS0246060.1 FKBP-type peptidyl-prolyl cis-trans isomerase [Microbacterium aurantiacum]